MTVFANQDSPVLSGVRVVIDLFADELAEPCLSKPSPTGNGMPPDSDRAVFRSQARLVRRDYVGLMASFGSI
jgi:hypothetical protein